MPEYTDSIILTMLIIGVLLLVWQKKRKFYRIKQFGSEEFPSFTKKITGRLSDALLQGIGYGCLLGGPIIWAIEYQAAWLSVILILAFALMIESNFYRSK